MKSSSPTGEAHFAVFVVAFTRTGWPEGPEERAGCGKESVLGRGGQRNQQAEKKGQTKIVKLPKAMILEKMYRYATAVAG